MIYRLRRKFVLISAGSLFLVFALIFALLYLCSALSVDRSLDALTDAVSLGGGRFPEPTEGGSPPPKKYASPLDRLDGEVRFSTRYFTVFYLADGTFSRADTEAIHEVDVEEAVLYAEGALGAGERRGWAGRYRYKIYETEEGGLAVSFVDGGMQKEQARSFLLVALAVLLAGCLLVTLLTVVFSRAAVRPAAQSYEKQKRFITDVAHECKTPLTLILANASIAEEEFGESPWLSDIRAEGEEMSALIRELVVLCRMDEGTPALSFVRFSLSEAVEDALSEFAPLIKKEGKTLHDTVEHGVYVYGDEGALRRVLSILLDNAVKYCDEGGEIVVRLTGGRHPSLAVENSFRTARDAETERFFDRFYRADTARTAGSGFGIGLSIARATVEAHRGSLTASAERDGRVLLRMTLPPPKKELW